jgi:dethiobiotin synthetase
MGQGYFITGTDTNVGKTWATVALMRHLKNQGQSVIGIKPVASGCTMQNGLLVNEDALLLQDNATVELDYRQVNPYAFPLPVSPHIAGKDNPVDLDVIANSFNAVKGQAEVILVEGAGGWHSPLNECQDNGDLAVALELPVILVVAIRLGCINHARLTYRAIISSGVNCAGWIAVCVNPNELHIEENIATLRKWLDSSLLGVLPFVNTPDFNGLARQFSLATL